MPTPVHAHLMVPPPENEPVLGYEPGSPERAALKEALARMSGEVVDIPMRIGGEDVRTGETRDAVMPHRHRHVIGRYAWGDTGHVGRAIDAALSAKREWSLMPFETRAAIFLKAAELIAGRYRADINAATILGQSKNFQQAEIDAACELVDFLRFNVAYAEGILAEQPESAPGVWNWMDWRPLDGFVFAVTPFNFTAIAGNLPTAPALMGNTVVWKPSLSSMPSNWLIMEILREAGLPDGVINFVAGDPAGLSDAALSHPDLGGLHFTGSTKVLRGLFRRVGENIDRYRQYPRIVGESGGKDFVVIHPSAGDDLDAVATALVRGAFEYQGQKCSAASRAYAPASLWPAIEERVVALVKEIALGDPALPETFMGAVIHEAAFERITGYQKQAASDGDVTVVTGGKGDDSEGWFVEPTLVRTTNPRHRLMTEEIFGPVLTVHVYDDAKFEAILDECDAATEYALTGAIFARDRSVVETALSRLRHAAGNFYINDKPTGAVVGQQPFGGGRASGTNDKAGAAQNLLRWASPRAVKETFVPPRSPWYPHQQAD